MPRFARSWPELKEPSYTKRNAYSAEDWLTYKRIDDGTEGLWRIHDKLYDLHEFVDKHPGGAQWLEISEGTDCTEAFESHHLSGKPELVLEKYFIRPATTPRNSPYTFHEDGFYKTLKRRTRDVLETLPKDALRTQSNVIMDSLVVVALSSAMMAAYWDSYTTATFSGILLGFACVASHNFLHLKDNWRMYYFNLSLKTVRGWRISHVLSHHGHTNSLLDLDLTEDQPFLNFLPDPEKNWTKRYLSWLLCPVAYAIGSHTEALHRLAHNQLLWSDVISLVIPVLLYVTNGGYVFSAIAMWTWLVLVSSFVVNANTALASHHHPTCFHEGDTPRQDRDWGLAMMDATKDSPQSTGSLALTLMMFGEHTLHHLLPEVDHSLLKYLYPAFHQTCKEFGIKYKYESAFSLLISGFQQLANNKPKQIPPQ